MPQRPMPAAQPPDFLNVIEDELPRPLYNRGGHPITSVSNRYPRHLAKDYTITDTAWVSEAKKYIGLHEQRDTSELAKLLNCDPSKTPWCADFVNSVLQNTGKLNVLTRYLHAALAIEVNPHHVNIVMNNQVGIGGNLSDMVKLQRNYGEPAYGYRYPEGFEVPRIRPTIWQRSADLPSPYKLAPRLGAKKLLAEQILREMFELQPQR